MIGKAVSRTLVHLHAPHPVGLDDLVPNWTFEPSTPDVVTRLQRWRRLGPWSAGPATRTLVSVTPAPRWIAYFIYLPDGGLTAAHRFTQPREREADDTKLLVVCATPDGALPPELGSMVDALYWKALDGFDFSAYSLMISEVARWSAGADLLVLNDSVMGPFAPLHDLWPQMQWDLTGFTASATCENHVQSYGFFLRDVRPETIVALQEVFPSGRALDDYRRVVLQQETRFARVAHRSMSVGTLWFAPKDRCYDPSLFAAVPLIEAGFPFLKRSLLTKHAGVYSEGVVEDLVRSLGHPLP